MVSAFLAKVSHVRKGLVIVGVILLVLGAVLAFVPLVSQSVQQTGSASSSGFTGYVWDNNGIFLPAMVKVSWTSSSDAAFFYITCTNTITQSQAQAANFNLTSSCNGMKTYGAQTTSFGGQTYNYDTGTSGSQSITVPGGGTLLFQGTSTGGSTINITANYPEPLIGLILLIVGVLLLLVGLVTGAKKPKAQTPPQAWGPGQQPGGAPSAGGPGASGQSWQQPPAQ